MRTTQRELDRRQARLLRYMRMTAREIGDLANRAGGLSEREARRLIDRARGQGHDVKCVAPRTFIHIV